MAKTGGFDSDFDYYLFILVLDYLEMYFGCIKYLEREGSPSTVQGHENKKNLPFFTLL